MAPTSIASQRYEEENLRISLMEQKQEFVDEQIEDIKDTIKDLPAIVQTLNYLAEQLTEHKEVHEKIDNKLECLSIDSIKRTSKVNLLWKALLFVVALGAGYIGNQFINGNNTSAQINEIQK